MIIGKPDLKIDSIYAFIAADDEGEGIMGAEMEINGKNMMMPLVGADIARIKSLYKIAEEISKVSNTSFKVYKFSGKMDITEEIRSL